MNTVRRQARDFSGFSESEQRMLGIYNEEDPDNPLYENLHERFERLGVGCKALREPVPRFRSAECELTLGRSNSMKYNTWIVMGRDRHGNMMTGYGGAGETQAGMIDIVVGRGGSEPSTEGRLNPSFIGQNSDCARIYISQKAKIDQYFNLASGWVGSADGTSAIGIKADDIRIMSRQGVKIVTGTDSHNSRDVELNSTYGIDLIAGNNDDDIQPLVKGDNLVACLVKIIDNLNQLNSVVDQLSSVVMNMNGAIMGHTHAVVPGPIPGSLVAGPSVTYTGAAGISAGIRNLVCVGAGLWTARANTMGLEANYLGPGGHGTQGAPHCILSRFNKTN